MKSLVEMVKLSTVLFLTSCNLMSYNLEANSNKLAAGGGDACPTGESQVKSLISNNDFEKILKSLNRDCANEVLKKVLKDINPLRYEWVIKNHPNNFDKTYLDVVSYLKIVNNGSNRTARFTQQEIFRFKGYEKWDELKSDPALLGKADYFVVAISPNGQFIVKFRDESKNFVFKVCTSEECDTYLDLKELTDRVFNPHVFIEPLSDGRLAGFVWEEQSQDWNPHVAAMAFGSMSLKYGFVLTPKDKTLGWKSPMSVKTFIPQKEIRAQIAQRHSDFFVSDKIDDNTIALLLTKSPFRGFNAPERDPPGMYKHLLLFDLSTGEIGGGVFGDINEGAPSHLPFRSLEVKERPTMYLLGDLPISTYQAQKLQYREVVRKHLMTGEEKALIESLVRLTKPSSFGLNPLTQILVLNPGIGILGDSMPSSCDPTNYFDQETQKKATFRMNKYPYRTDIKFYTDNIGMMLVGNLVVRNPTGSYYLNLINIKNGEAIAHYKIEGISNVIGLFRYVDGNVIVIGKNNANEYIIKKISIFN